MKKVIIPAIILGTVLYIGLGDRTDREAEPTLTPPRVEVNATSMPKIEISEAEIEETIIEIITPITSPVETSTPTPAPTPIPAPTPVPAPTVTQPVQTGDMVYVEGFGWLESQGEGTVIYDENIYENGNKVGIMD